VRNNHTVGLVLAGTFLAVSLIGLQGCSESKTSRAGRELLEQVSLAERLYTRVLALLANPVYRVGDQYAPLKTKIGSQANIEVAPAGRIHPEVFGDIKKMEQMLTAALAKAGGADDTDLALAHMMLAKAHALRGYCEMLAAEQARQRLGDARSTAGELLTAAITKVDLAGYYDLLASLSDVDLKAARRGAIAELAAIEDNIKDIDERLAAMAKEKKAKTVTYEQKNAEARSITSEASIGSAKQGLERLDKALKIKAVANRAEAVIAEIEHESGSLVQRRAELEIGLANAKSRIAAADDEIVYRKAIAAKSRAGVGEVQKALQADQAEIDRQINDMSKASTDFAAAMSRASNAYDLALAQLKQASAAAPADAGERRADIAMKQADIKAQLLATLRGNKNFVSELRRFLAKIGASEAPAQVGNLESFVPDPNLALEYAKKKYATAAKLYTQAIANADRNRRWAYQGQLAAAYANLYRLSGDAEALAAARDALSKALEGKRFSPYLAPLAELQKMLAKDKEG